MRPSAPPECRAVRRTRALYGVYGRPGPPDVVPRVVRDGTCRRHPGRHAGTWLHHRAGCGWVVAGHVGAFPQCHVGTPYVNLGLLSLLSMHQEEKHLPCWRVVVHLSVRACAPDMFAAGVSHSVAPAAPNAGGADFGLAQAVDEGTILGPRVLFTGGWSQACTACMVRGNPRDSRCLRAWQCMALQSVCAFAHHHVATCRSSHASPQATR